MFKSLGYFIHQCLIDFTRVKTRSTIIFVIFGMIFFIKSFNIKKPEELTIQIFSKVEVMIITDHDSKHFKDYIRIKSFDGMIFDCYPPNGDISKLEHYLKNEKSLMIEAYGLDKYNYIVVSLRNKKGESFKLYRGDKYGYIIGLYNRCIASVLGCIIYIVIVFIINKKYHRDPDTGFLDFKKPR